MYKILDELPPESQEAQPESYLGAGLRHAGRSVARGTESVLGLPGDVANLGLGLTNLGIEKVTGKESPLPSKVPLIPTSGDIRTGVTQKITGQHLEPKSETEAFGDEVISDLATFMLPVKGKVPFASAAKKALGSNFVKWAAENVTGSQEAGTAAKVGSLVLAGLPGGRAKITDFKDKSYADAYKNIPKNASKPLNPIKTSINKLKKSLGVDKPYRKEIIEHLDAIDKIAKGPKDLPKRANIEELIKTKQNWNEWIYKTDAPKQVKDELSRGVKILNDAIDKYGSTNKAFSEPYKVGEELTHALNSQNAVQRFLNKTPQLKDTPKNPVVKYLFYGAGHAGLTAVGLPKLAAGVAAVYGANKSAQAIQLLKESKKAQQLYKSIIKNSLKENAPAVARELSSLDALANKIYPPQNGYRIMDELPPA